MNTLCREFPSFSVVRLGEMFARLSFYRWPFVRSLPSSIILATVLIAGAAFTSIAQTSRPAELILPPADWDARTHALASLLTTNKPGECALPLVWAGTEKVTARIGW